MFSVTIIPISTIVPMAMAMPESATTLASTPNVFMAIKLINTARGPIVKQDDLKWALERGIIAGAALDVFEKEPPTDIDFLKLDNLICTPHIGGHSHEGLVAMGEHAINNLLDFFKHRDGAGSQ